MNLQLLTIEKDNLGNDIEFYRFDSLANSPAYTFFLRQMAELIDSGFGHPITSWEDKDCATVYCTHKAKIIGAIIYSTRTVEKQGSLWLILGSVVPEYQGNGIYRMLRQHFENIAKEYGCWGIASYVHKDNQAAIKMSEALGSKPIYYYMAKKI